MKVKALIIFFTGIDKLFQVFCCELNLQTKGTSFECVKCLYSLHLNCLFNQKCNVANTFSLKTVFKNLKKKQNKSFSICE